MLLFVFRCSCYLSLCMYKYVSLSPSGATVLFVNATDLDASREFGQASLIYSLQGSSQFRLNTRSGGTQRTRLHLRRVTLNTLVLTKHWPCLSISL